ncbi:hypothetical protein [Aureispira anguillae]|uniref:Uncharacterized protein n=1 Tax=Aureispira anguillae TaxID=2864201 RepID=A0A915YHQ3_9BACT|nr:hypothetical protein [Aureispira anguillae]BDS13393.1 hypothetical protein AsAng_0041300 [Aureispira anguillae]
MKTPSNALFKLIRKMTPSEKRYFKRFGLLQQKKDSNKYILLFDAINEQGEYNEQALLKQFKGYDFINNFSEIKKYLFNQIQKALRNYHSQSSIDIILYNYLSDISVLYSKELYVECSRIIKKAKKVATKHEKFSLLLILNEWKRNVLRISHHVNGIQSYLEEEVTKDKEYISCVENESLYFNKSLELTLHLRKKGPDHKIESSITLPEEGPKTFRAKRYFFLLRSMEGYLEYDDEKIFEVSSADVQIFEQNPHFIQALPKQYIISLTNLLDSCANKIKYNDVFDEYMEKTIKALDTYSFDSEFSEKERLLVYIIKCTVYSSRGNIEDLKVVRQELKEQYLLTSKKGYKTPDLDIYLHDNLMRSALITGDFSSALESYNDILQLNMGSYREDLQMETRLLGLILHFELGNWLLLESMVRSALRLLQRKHSHFKLGKLFLEVIKKCVLIKQQPNSQDDDIIPILLQLKKDALAITSKNRLADYIVFIGWVDSKIKNKSIASCIYEVTQSGYRL